MRNQGIEFVRIITDYREIACEYLHNGFEVYAAENDVYYTLNRFIEIA